jgi:hypothetical protein
MQELPDEDRELQERRLLELTAAVQDEEEAGL